MVASRRVVVGWSGRPPPPPAAAEKEENIEQTTRLVRRCDGHIYLQRSKLFGSPPDPFSTKSV